MDSSSSGTRWSSCSISVPFPTPDGPVMTKTFPKTSLIMTPPTAAKSSSSAELLAQLCDEFGALALGEAADGLRRGDPALVEDPVGLHPAVLGDGEEHVEHLCGEDVLGWVEEDRLDAGPVRLQVLLQLGPGGADVVRAPEGVHSLIEGPLGSRERRFD